MMIVPPVNGWTSPVFFLIESTSHGLVETSFSIRQSEGPLRGLGPLLVKVFAPEVLAIATYETIERTQDRDTNGSDR